MRNKYIKYAQISERKFRTVLRLFSLDIEAKKVAEFTGLSRGCVNNIFYKLRERIAELCEAESPFENGEVELDESYFGARRVRGKRGRGAQGKTPVFGMLKRGCRVYTQVVKNCSAGQLMPIIQGKADTDAVIYSDGFRTYDGLADFGYKKHYRVKHGENEFAVGTNHINGIENFWGLCKVRLSKFRGVHKHMFYLHIKECEFRYNCRNKNIYFFLLKELRKTNLTNLEPKIIIAEKPSVAKSIAAIVGANNKKDGYIEGNGIAVTWAFGHLVGLAMPGAYAHTESISSTRYSFRVPGGTLPILLAEFKLLPRLGK